MYPQHFHVCANFVILSLLHVHATPTLMLVASVCTTDLFVCCKLVPPCLPTLMPVEIQSDCEITNTCGEKSFQQCLLRKPLFADQFPKLDRISSRLFRRVVNLHVHLHSSFKASLMNCPFSFMEYTLCVCFAIDTEKPHVMFLFSVKYETTYFSSQ